MLRLVLLDVSPIFEQQHPKKLSTGKLGYLAGQAKPSQVYVKRLTNFLSVSFRITCRSQLHVATCCFAMIHLVEVHRLIDLSITMEWTRSVRSLFEIGYNWALRIANWAESARIRKIVFNCKKKMCLTFALYVTAYHVILATVIVSPSRDQPL